MGPSAYPLPVRVLALDTSTEVGSVAVLVDGAVAAEAHALVRARHGETWSVLVEQVLAWARLSARDLDLIGVGIGPGSFTGTRVGVAAAKGLAISIGCPLAGVVSLRALARGAPGDRIACVVDAHKGEVYAAAYEREGARLIERIAPFHATPEVASARLRDVASIAVGSGLRRYPELGLPELGLCCAEPIFDVPRGGLIALEALERWRGERNDERATLEPLYVRPSDAVLPERPLEDVGSDR
ncbi:MAG: tRNA (adenosine(37)-N6)-threonylcarbamoyltransferase complex dimerization subunit type 1 TsaB [Sandaracinaceae bacterium]|nr:tRNA (adenosine(37)-N6)-threonylcarbamoyltransferase complex dimerization subunit type 1 TsaB [Sandaracinaceae bacterium]